MRYLTLLLLATVACSGDGIAPTDGEPPAEGDAQLELVAQGLTSPVYLTSPAGDDRLFVVEQPGRIRIIRDGELLDQPFLDITDRVTSGGERGLLSVAFHPAFALNGYFYVDYTDSNGDTRVERYQASNGADFADGSSAQPVLSVPQPFANHNGGLVAFGPDGMLYVGMGDGGGSGDPESNGQSRASLLGGLLRIDVDHGLTYAIPADNPFVGQSGVREELWATGLRNPWRYAFDTVDGNLYIADVGQDQYEEVDVVSATDGGLNFGWNIMEGMHCYRFSVCDKTGLTQPVLEYDHGDGCSITGGYVYRGTAIPGLVGHYFYADYCNGWVRSFHLVNGEVTDQREWPFGDIGQILSFGQDAAGELYLLSVSGSDGRVYRMVPASGS